MAGRQAARTSGRADSTHSRWQACLIARKQDGRNARKRERLLSNYPARLMDGLINGMKE